MAVHQDLAMIDRLQHLLAYDLVGRSYPKDLTIVQQEQPIAVLGGEVQIVRNKDNGQPILGVQAPEDRADIELVAQVEEDGRLVEQQDPGCLRQRTGDDGPLAFPIGDLADRPTGQRQDLHSLLRLLRESDISRRFPPESRETASTLLVWEPPHQHRFHDGKGKQELALLRNQRNGPSNLRLGERVDGAAKQVNGAFLMPEYLGQEFQERRFA